MKLFKQTFLFYQILETLEVFSIVLLNLYDRDSLRFIRNCFRILTLKFNIESDYVYSKTGQFIKITFNTTYFQDSSTN